MHKAFLPLIDLLDSNLRFSESFGILDLVLILCHFDQVLGFIADYQHIRQLIEPSRSVLDSMTEDHRSRAWLLGVFNCLNILSRFSIGIIALFCHLAGYHSQYG